MQWVGAIQYSGFVAYVYIEFDVYNPIQLNQAILLVSDYLFDAYRSDPALIQTSNRVSTTSGTALANPISIWNEWIHFRVDIVQSNIISEEVSDQMHAAPVRLNAGLLPANMNINPPPLPPSLAFLDESPKKRKKKFNQNKENKYPKQGRPAVHTIYPEAVASAERFINENRFQADPHRASDTGFCGVTSPQLRDSVLNDNPRIRAERPNLSKYIELKVP